jgi:hypothetical protein
VSPYRAAQLGWVERLIARQRRERFRENLRAWTAVAVLFACFCLCAWWGATRAIAVDTRGVHVEACP